MSTSQEKWPSHVFMPSATSLNKMNSLIIDWVQNEKQPPDVSAFRSSIRTQAGKEAPAATASDVLSAIGRLMRIDSGWGG